MAKIQEFISPSIVGNLAEELLNEIGRNIEIADTELYERKKLEFRDVINSSFPTMLVVDYDSIRNELKQYQDIDTALSTYIEKTLKPTQKDYSNSKLSNKEIELIVKTIRRAIRNLAATPVSYLELVNKLNKIYDISQTSAEAVRLTKTLFNKTYRLTDIGGVAEVLIFPSFSRIGDLVRRQLDIALITVEAEEQTTLSSVESIGTLLAYGHTAVGYVTETGDTVLKFNSPKLVAIMFDILQTTQNSGTAQAVEQAVKAATSFVEDTRQAEVYISIDKDFSENFVKMFVNLGGNIVKFENSLINSRRGTVLEKKVSIGANKAVLAKLAAAFAKTENIVGRRLARYLTNKKSSPNLIEYITHIITSKLSGQKAQSYSSKGAKETKTFTTRIKKQVVTGIVSKKVTLPKLQKPKTTIPSNIKSVSNLTKLETLLRLKLTEQIKQNMGDGNRRDVLNLRSGRFAESAELVKLTQGREGLITAFYTYMKNPYATFSSGGRQQYPRSRDPKLLISKSIRELAAEQAVTRLRAVAV